jgi:hypothetical protein
VARKYAPQVTEALVKIATTGKSDSARVAAATPILDPAFPILCQRDALVIEAVSERRYKRRCSRRPAVIS